MLNTHDFPFCENLWRTETSMDKMQFIFFYYSSTSDCVCVCVCVHSLSCVWLFATPWTVTHQTPPSMEFSRQENWSGLPFPTPGYLLDPGFEPVSPASSAFAGRMFITDTPGKPHLTISFANTWWLGHVLSDRIVDI